jgi:hypothetical protein
MTRKLEWIIERSYSKKGIFIQPPKSWARAGVDFKNDM